MTTGADPRSTSGSFWRWGRRAALLAALASVTGLVAASHRARNDSAACTSCHTAAQHPPPWRSAGGHDSLACQECHATTARLGLRLQVGGVTGGTLPKHGFVDAARCTSCHDRNTERWRAVADTAGHRAHEHAAKRVDCLGCHADSTHGSKKPGETCTSCHAADVLHARTHGGDTCLTCHNYSAEHESHERLTIAQCVRCHGDEKNLELPPGSDVVAAKLVVTGEMLHGGVDCKLCHQPHRAMPREPAAPPAAKAAPTPVVVRAVVPAKPEKAPVRDAALHPAGQQTPPEPTIVSGDEVCHRCHQIQIATADRPVPEGHTNCVRCHSAHAPLDQFVKPCVECHEQGKDALEKKTTAGHHDNCVSCHMPHTWLPAQSGCVQCHKDKDALVLAQAPPEHQQCRNCHKPHSSAPPTAGCVGCHSNKAAHVKTAPRSHATCVGCHEPHSVLSGPRACAGCHAGQNHQLVAGGPATHAKQGCLGCHQQHGRPILTPARCPTCHEDKGKLVAAAGPAPHRVCASCHRPHDFKPGACARCHQTIGQAPGAHSGTCTKCHNQHGSPAVPRSACLACHTQVDVKPPPGNTQHAACGSCHKPHQSSGAGATQCTSCHGDKAAVAKSWPASSAHAGPCNGCHTPHNVLQKKPCAGCHTNQAASAKGGRHRCEQCHQPHAAPLAGGGAGWWGRCASCHARQKADATAGGKHTDCSKCHKPHQFSKPACTSCHAGQDKKGAHGVAGHKNCGACHSTHLAGMPGRAHCLSCHKDKTEHHPQAKVCQACHMFQ